MSEIQSWCGHAHHYQIEIRLWGESTPHLMRHDKNCLRMVTSITVCADCKSKVTVADMLTPEGKERIAGGIAKVGKAMPDFAGAKLHFIEVIDKPLTLQDLIPPGADVTEA